MDTELLIDEQAATFILEPAELRSWARRQRVFVSSLITDMAQERRAVREAIESVGAVPVMFEEELGAQDVSSTDAYIGGVRTSHIYIGLFGSRYGVRTPTGYSATEDEFQEAKRLGLRLAVFANTGADDVEGGQRDFVNGLRNVLTTSPWTDPADLGRRVARRLADLAAEELAPWVRLGDTVFRATKIDTNGDSFTVEAVIQNPRILARLNDIKDGRVPDLRFTSPDVSKTVQLRELRSSMTSTATRSVTLTLVAGQQDQGGMRGTLQTNGQTYTQADLARLALSDSLFGTKTYPANWGSPGDTTDPLEPLRGRGIADSVVRPVSRLLISERLLRRGEASHIDAFTLGPSWNGTRRLAVTWTPPRPYVNYPTPDQVSVEGDLSGL